jgi:predicted DCC family thiol-disulfide oxidoreductase YuxK
MSPPPGSSLPGSGESLTSDAHPLLLFFDGECAFCNRWVARVKDADVQRRTRFATKQGPTFQRVAQVHPEVRNVESVVLVARRPDGREEFLVRNSAIRRLLTGLPRFKLFAWVLHLTPAPLSDLGYWIFSKLRTRLFGKWRHCRVPLEEDRELFLD